MWYAKKESFEDVSIRISRKMRLEKKEAIERLRVELPALWSMQQEILSLKQTIAVTLKTMSLQEREILNNWVRFGDYIYRVTDQGKVVRVHVPDMCEAGEEK